MERQIVESDGHLKDQAETEWLSVGFINEIYA